MALPGWYYHDCWMTFFCSWALLLAGSSNKSDQISVWKFTPSIVHFFFCGQYFMINTYMSGVFHSETSKLGATWTRAMETSFQKLGYGGIWRMIGDPLKVVYWDFPALPWRHGWMKEVPVSRGWTAACLDRTMIAGPAGGVDDHTVNVGLGFVLKMTMNARSQFPQILTMIFHHCPSLFLFIIFHHSHHLTRIVIEASEIEIGR